MSGSWQGGEGVGEGEAEVEARGLGGVCVAAVAGAACRLRRVTPPRCLLVSAAIPNRSWARLFLFWVDTPCRAPLEAATCQGSSCLDWAEMLISHF